MASQTSIRNFLELKKLAVLGVSRDSKQFPNYAYRFLKSQGFTVYPVNPHTQSVENDRCYPNVRSIPDPVDGALIVLPPEKTMQVLPEIAEHGIKNIWIQQKSETPNALQFCTEHDINVISGECIMMFAEPIGFPHRMHRWIRKISGTFPT